MRATFFSVLALSFLVGAPPVRPAPVPGFPLPAWAGLLGGLVAWQEAPGAQGAEDEAVPDLPQSDPNPGDDEAVPADPLPDGGEEDVNPLGKSDSPSVGTPQKERASPASVSPKPTASRSNAASRRDTPRRDRTSSRASLRNLRNAEGKTPRSSSPADAKHQTNTVQKLGFAYFKVIAERNIFNSTRAKASVRAAADERKPTRQETVTLVGTLSSDKGTYAFFDSPVSEFKKAVPVGQSIAGFRIAEILPSQVKLDSGTNLVELVVGGHLRRDGQAWQVAERGGQPTVTATSPAGTPSDSGGGEENDIIQRLMRQREAELK